MTKKIFFALFLFLILLGNSAFASSFSIEATDSGQVILDSKDSIDGNSYILNNVSAGETYNVTQTLATSFISVDNGLFDNVDFTTTCNPIVYDNVSTTSAVISSSCEFVFDSDYYFTSLYFAGYGSAYKTFYRFYYDEQLIHSANISTYSGGYHIFDFKEKILANRLVVENPSKVSEIEVFGQPIIDYQSVSGLETKNITYNSASVVFKNPDINLFVRNEIYLDDQKVYEGLNQNYTFKDLEPLTDYVVTVRSYYTDGVYVDSIVNFTTVEKPDVELQKDITNLKAKVDFDRVDLSWNVPENDGFEFVKIYRKENEDVGLIRSMFSNEYTPLFETNGTYFNDLTVEPESKYQYLLTTFIDGTESDGVTIDVATPRIYVGGSDVVVDEESGDYIITWEKPTTGKLLVKVGGKEYATVNASDLQIIIPKEDMKFKLGLPDVTLTPLDENGAPIGKPSMPDGSDMGSVIGDVELSEDLNPNNLLLIIVGLFGLVGMFVLLALAVRFVPKLFNIIAKALKGGSRA